MGSKLDKKARHSIQRALAENRKKAKAGEYAPKYTTFSNEGIKSGG